MDLDEHMRAVKEREDAAIAAAVAAARISVDRGWPPSTSYRPSTRRGADDVDDEPAE